MPAAKQKILVVRNDKIGDFMLAWPALKLLRHQLPEAEIHVLVPTYTHPLAQACPWVDQSILDPGPKAHKKQQKALITNLKSQGYDAALTLFSTWRTGRLLARAKIPLRVAPATKLAQLWYTHTLKQRRSRSEKPEWRYNLELAHFMLEAMGELVLPVNPPFWPLNREQRAQQKDWLQRQYALPKARPWFFLHTGSGGSAVNLDAYQYLELATALSQRLQGQPWWILTAGPDEEAQALWLQDQLLERDIEASVYTSKHGLSSFALSLSAADLFISGSTGPLHIAGALDVPTVGFYPGHKSATSLRWQTCNSERRTWAISPPEGGDISDMRRIHPQDAALEITRYWETLAAATPKDLHTSQK